ncbi:uncharacterized protein LOC130962866 [Arachis stenosperma]|uniref:uncharacterized protein LOC130962866 n=1 Tax=Arachis stenosperma TaxID=217475 RepID=UPI0025AD52F5|nr:uncharacterized protein LOC130962866 [Arachis stenosperma]
MGDFNEIVHIEERKRATNLSASAEDFKAWLNDMELVDLAINDRKYTWFRGQSCSRIDRSLVSLEWLDAYPDTRLRGGPRGLSDHCPLIVEDRRIAQGPRPFRSLDAWFTHEGFPKMMKEEGKGLCEVQFLDKLKALTKPLGRWHKQHFGNIHEKIQRFEDEIKKVDDMVSNGIYDGTVEARRKALVRRYEVWYERQDIHWKQMSRSQHAKEMDRNIRYFHNIASARRRNNRIESLVINRRLVKNHAWIKVAIRDFYRNLYHQDESPNISFQDGLVNRLEMEEAQALEVLPMVEKVKEAVWDCESSKAPSSNGYNMNFIKRCWEEIGVEITKAVMRFFETERLPAASNITWVVLAPKFVGAKEIKDLRLISMVGCIYEVILKVLTRRMRTVMPGLFGESHSAFVKGRRIHDGALIACETIQWPKMKKKASTIIKLDFQKADDRIKWKIVDIVLEKIRFGRRWRAWITECIRSASISIMVNGAPSKPFKKVRGLRQGDLLSLFLFILVVDVLNRMIGEVVRNRRISPLLVGRDNVELSHLQFIDDTILFCTPDDKIVRNYKRLLRCFEVMSGLSINFDKSSLIP